MLDQLQQHPRVALALVVLVVLLGLAVGALVLARIWRRRLAEAAEPTTQTLRFVVPARLASPYELVVGRVKRRLDRGEREHRELLAREMRAGARRRPVDWQHRRGVPIHPS